MFVPQAELSGLSRIRQVMRAIRTFKPDLIVAHTVIPAAYTRVAAVLSGWRIRSRADRKLAIVLHAGDNDDFADLPFHLSEKVLTYMEDMIVTVSEESLKNYCLRVRRHPNIRRIANGIDLRRFHEPAQHRDEIRGKLGLAGQRLILQVGRLSKVKQQLLSLEAMLPLLRNDPNLQLWFAGLAEVPEYEARLHQAVRDCGVTERVRIMGSRNDVPELLAAADLYLMPSTMEAHSVALIEALASGVPVIASDISTFLYAAELPGVSLVGIKDAEAMGAAAQRFLGEGKRYSRNLDVYDIAETERQYRRLING